MSEYMDEREKREKYSEYTSEYKAVSSENLETLNMTVTMMLKEGWCLYKGPFALNDMVVQPMVRRIYKKKHPVGRIPNNDI